MVDPVNVEHKPLAVDGEANAKSGRRRNNRRSNPRPKQADSVVKDESKKSESRPNSRRQMKPRAPRVEGDEPQSNGFKDKAEYNDGVLRLKVSSNRPRTIYTRLVRLMLAGYDTAGNTLELTQPITKVEVSALGNAIGPAIFVADNLIKGGVVTQQSVTADFVLVEGDQVSATTSDNKFKGSPRLVLTLEKVEDWNPLVDEVLTRTRVFRSKVLGLPEEEDVAAAPAEEEAAEEASA